MEKFNALKGAFAFEKLTIGAAASGLTATVYHVKSSTNVPNKIAEYATISVESFSIRYRTDGTDPDSTTGHLVTSGSIIVLTSADDVRKFRAIRVTSDATIQVSYA